MLLESQVISMFLSRVGGKSGKMIWLRWIKFCPLFLGIILAEKNICSYKKISMLGLEFHDLEPKVRKNAPDMSGKGREFKSTCSWPLGTLNESQATSVLFTCSIFVCFCNSELGRTVWNKITACTESSRFVMFIISCFLYWHENIMLGTYFAQKAKIVLFILAFRTETEVHTCIHEFYFAN